MKENENLKYYKEPKNKKCSICGGKEDYLGFIQIKDSTCPTGMYFKYVGYVCSKCREQVLVPLLKNFTQVWDTYEFEGHEMNEHLLVKPEIEQRRANKK